MNDPNDTPSTIPNPVKDAQVLREERLLAVQSFAREAFDEISGIRAHILTSPLRPLIEGLMAESRALRTGASSQEWGRLIISPCEMLVEAVARLLPPTYPYDERGHFRRARGILISQSHSWFVVEIPGLDIGDPAPWWRYIIDPAVPDASPQCLLLGPGSPLQLAYHEDPVAVQEEPEEATEPDDADRT